MASDDEEEMAAMRRLRAHLPSSFGIQKQEVRKEEGLERVSKSKVAPRVGPLKPGPERAQTHQELDEFSAPSRKERKEISEIPASSEAVLVGHEKAVTALAVDHSGARVATGARDCRVLLYDFGGMRSSMEPFRRLHPCGAHPVRSLSFAPQGSGLLVVSGAPTAAFLDREGMELGETVRGDMYVRDLKNTKGHIMALTDGHWHPSDRETVLTSSEDGTLRLWDPDRLQSQKLVVKPTPIRPGRVGIGSCCFHPNGKLVAAGLSDGTLQMWDVSSNVGHSAAVGLVAPPKEQMVSKQDWKYVMHSKRTFRTAHEPGETITCVRISPDGNQIASRCTDHTLKIWDLRSPSKPLALFSDLPVKYEQTELCFAPRGSYLLTCTSAEDRSPGMLVAIDRNRLEVVKTFRMPGHAVRVHWHPQLNQIFVGCGDKGTGSTQILYDEDNSTRGALLAVSRKSSKAKDVFLEERPVIHTPFALPLFREEPMVKRRKQKEEGPAPQRFVDPSQVEDPTRIPQGKLLTQYLLKERGLVKHTDFSEDPRDALLSKQEEIDRTAPLYTKAYAKTQPDVVFAESSEEEG